MKLTHATATGSLHGGLGLPAPKSWRASGVLMWVTAAAFGLPAVPVAVYLLKHSELPWLFGLFPMYGGPVDAWVGPRGYALLILLFGVLCLAEATVGVLLWRGRRVGAVLSFVLLPFEIAFWLGFALPFPPLCAAVRLALTLWGWTWLRARAR
jgi:hypothetical protein